MHVSDSHQFSDIHISQGSVATYLRCGGIFKYEFVANLPLVNATYDGLELSPRFYPGSNEQHKLI